MKKKYQLLLLSIALMSFENAISQNKMLPCKIITNSKDTISGIIDYKNWYSNPRKIYFYPNGQSTSNVYFPKDISGFEVNGETYLSAFLKIDITIENTLNSKEANYIQDSVFLLALTKGSVSLYYLKQFGGKENFFIRDTSGKIMELIKRSYLVYEDESVKLKTNETYKGQLRFHLIKCKEVSDKAQFVDFRRSSLTKLFKSYYDCTNEKSASVPIEEKIKLRFGISSGLKISKLSFSSTDPYNNYLTNSHFNIDYNPYLGIDCEIILPRSLKKWSLFNELNYAFFNFKSNTDIKFSFSIFKMLNLIRYTIPVSGIKPYLEIGVANGIYNISTNTQLVKFLTTSYTDVALRHVSNYEFAISGGVGVKINKNLCVDYRYEKSNGFSGTGILYSKIENNIINITYLF